VLVRTAFLHAGGISSTLSEPKEPRNKVDSRNPAAVFVKTANTREEKRLSSLCSMVRGTQFVMAAGQKEWQINRGRARFEPLDWPSVLAPTCQVKVKRDTG